MKKNTTTTATQTNAEFEQDWERRHHKPVQTIEKLVLEAGHGFETATNALLAAQDRAPKEGTLWQALNALLGKTTVLDVELRGFVHALRKDIAYGNRS